MTSPASRLVAVSAHLSPSAPSAPSPNWSAAKAALRHHFPSSQLSFDLETRQQHGSSWGSFTLSTPPSVVVHATKTADVVAVVRIASQHGIVIIPTGGRTGLEGQFLPAPAPPGLDEEKEEGEGEKGGGDSCRLCNPGAGESWTGGAGTSAVKVEQAKSAQQTKVLRPTIHLSLSRMNRVLAIHEQDFQAIVEPGVGWQSLNAHLAEKGIKLFFPVDPAPGSEFGGMVGVGGSGTNAVGYGTMRAEWITSLEVVLMDGSVIKTKGSSRARSSPSPLPPSLLTNSSLTGKSSTGWDTGRLFLGSEGTLGIITQVTVRLAPLVPLKVALTSFPTVALAVSSVVQILTTGLTPTSLELLDGTSVRGLNLSKILPENLREEPTVLMRFGNLNDEVNLMALEKVSEIVRRNGGTELRIAKDGAENDLLWKARKNQYWSQQLLIGDGCRTLITDICVPISRLAEFVATSDIYVQESGLVAPIVAHIGDGNVHRAILWKGAPGETAAPAEVEALAKRLVKLALSLEGTCAGEHGIGLMKRKYLKEELGGGTLKLMRRVKNLLDPLQLLNPDKVLFPEGEEQ